MRKILRNIYNSFGYSLHTIIAFFFDSILGQIVTASFIFVFLFYLMCNLQKSFEIEIRNWEPIFAGILSATVSIVLAIILWRRESKNKEENKQENFLKAQPWFAVWFSNEVIQENDTSFPILIQKLVITNISINPASCLSVGRCIVPFMRADGFEKKFIVNKFEKPKKDFVLNLINDDDELFPNKNNGVLAEYAIDYPASIDIYYNDKLGNFCVQRFVIQERSSNYVIEGLPKTTSRNKFDYGLGEQKKVSSTSEKK